MNVKQKAFTLIEVMVALVIVAWVLTSAYSAISAFADQRVLMQKRFQGQSVAWNELMERYRTQRGWNGDSQSSRNSENSGVITENGMRWRWQFQQEAALGRGVVKQTVSVYSEGENDNPDAALVLFQVQGQPSLTQ